MGGMYKSTASPSISKCPLSCHFSW